MKSITNKLKAIIEKAKTLGLPEQDLINATVYLENNEYRLCFDTIITQMYEYDISIDFEFYELIDNVGTRMKVSFENYSFIKELIRFNSVL